MKASQQASFVPWEKRQSSLIWRGSVSNCRFPSCKIALADDSPEEMEMCGRGMAGEGRDCTWNFSSWLQMPRGRLVWLGRFIPWIDAKFAVSSSRHLEDHVLESNLADFLHTEGLIADTMRLEDQAWFKYFIAVEGDSAADRLYWQLFMGSVVLIPSSPWRVLALQDLLEPYVHYVPVRYDLSDVVEKVLWLREHDVEAKAIARNGMQFAQRYLTCDGVLYYVDRLVRAYADRLR